MHLTGSAFRFGEAFGRREALKVLLVFKAVWARAVCAWEARCGSP